MLFSCSLSPFLPLHTPNILLNPHPPQTDNLDPALDRDPNPHPSFTFWKAGALRFRDFKDCWEQCYSCLAKGIQAGRAVKNQCNYQAKWGTLGSTCEMGYDYDGVENLAATNEKLFLQEKLGVWTPFQGWNGTTLVAPGGF